MQAGWYSDPNGRYEFRYFNGVAWTADVSVDGVRQVDQLGTAPTPAGGPAPGPAVYSGAGSMPVPNGLATAALVLGIVGVALGVLIVLFWVAFPIGILALVLGLVARRRAAHSGVGRPQATAGVILGPLAMALGVVGLILVLPDLRDAFRDATRQLEGTAALVEISGCRLDGSDVQVAGTVVNRTSTAHTVEIEIAVRPPGTSTPLTTVRVTVFDLLPDERREFAAVGDVGDGNEEILCAVDSVSIG